jgi:hypothetical protein
VVRATRRDRHRAATDLSREFGLSETCIGILSGAHPAGGTLGALCGAWLASEPGSAQRPSCGCSCWLASICGATLLVITPRRLAIAC